MAPYRILISSDLNLHREVLLGVLLAQRPDLEVHAVAPSDIDAVASVCPPFLVICNDRAVIVRTNPFAWILLYPDGENVAHLGVGETRRTIRDASMHELVGFIDEATSTAQPVP